MALLKIAKLGEPVLRRVAEPITPEELASSEVQRFIDDMIETMRDADGIGLAAPQVFVGKQICVLELKPNGRYPWSPALPLVVLVNPAFTDLSGEPIPGWEGCLSVDNLRGQVFRYPKASLSALGRHGERITLEAEGFLAVVLQHETDHLLGKVFLDRMTDLSTLTHQREYDRYWKSEESTPA